VRGVVGKNWEGEATHIPFLEEIQDWENIDGRGRGRECLLAAVMVKAEGCTSSI